MPSLLITGATGYIGGTILHQLLHSTDENVKSLSVTAVTRRPESAPVLERLGVKTTLIRDLGDEQALRAAARAHDIVVNVATGQHAGAPRALIEGLGQRATPTYFIQLSGTTNVTVPAVTQTPHKLQSFTDADGARIYEYEKAREADYEYPQRTADVVTVEAGEEHGVNTVIVMPPTVYGTGSGAFRRESHQIPTMTRAAMAAGHPVYLASDATAIGNVHVADLAELYELIVASALRGDERASYGREGYYFANNGHHDWREIASEIGRVGVELGVLADAQPRGLSLEDATDTLGGRDAFFAEACFGSHSDTLVEKSYELGWRPTRTQGDCEASIRQTFEAMLRDK